MSLDYPLYEELLRRNHPAAKWWRIGDILYYLGLLPAFISFALMPLAVVKGLSGQPWTWTVVAFSAFCFSLSVFFIGLSLKGRAYKMAERDGIREPQR